MLNPFHGSTNQELFRKHLCNQSSCYEKYGQFPLRKGSYHMYHQIEACHFQQRLMEDKDKSMKNALYVLWYAKRRLSRWSNIEHWNNQA